MQSKIPKAKLNRQKFMVASKYNKYNLREITFHNVIPTQVFHTEVGALGNQRMANSRIMTPQGETRRYYK